MRLYLFTFILYFLFFLSSGLRGSEGIEWSRASLWLEKGDFIEVTPPPKAKKIILEHKNSLSGKWDTVNTGHLPETANGKLYFQIPFDMAKSQVRLQWTETQTFPFSFYQGRSKFLPKKGDINSANLFKAATMLDSVETETEPSTDNGTDKIEESDLWKILGNKLFFFNQLRGLQIIDLSFPEQPKVTANYRLPASGEQMYVTPDGSHAFLITRTPHQSWPHTSRIQILKTNDDNISKLGAIELNGAYRDSRMVNNTLYVISEKWETNRIEESNWKFLYSTQIESFDLANPETPIKINEQIVAGSPQIISANNSNIMVVTRDPSDYYNKHVVRVYDITHNNGMPRLISKFKPGGRVLDKFKLRIRNGILTVISQAYREKSWSNRYSLLENFDLQTGQILGSLELAERETLYATRFDGNYAYIVTFLQTDPLFIIDLSNPMSPSIVSELIVPGWSEYIQVINDKLFAVGVESNTVTASLFDISNKKFPRLAHRVYLGEDGGNSWSEANYNEKAIGYLANLGIFLIPYQSWENGQYVNKVQILELSNNGLQKRGTIAHRFQARRATPDQTGMKIFSISGNELCVTNFINREKPEPITRLPLAWKVDRAYPINDLLVQIEEKEEYSWGWHLSGTESNSTIRISKKESPDILLSATDLGGGALAGSFINQDVLHVLMIEDQKLRAQAFSIEKDGELSLQGMTSIKYELNNPIKKFKAFALDRETICWASKPIANYAFPHYRIALMSDSIYPYYNRDMLPMELHIFSVEKNLGSITLTHESNATLKSSENSDWGNPIFIKNQLLYGSTKTHTTYDSKESSRIVISEVNASIHIIDFSDKTNPKIRDPLPAPGMLHSISPFLPGKIESYLFFESKGTSLRKFSPITLKEQNESVNQKEKFGRSLSACIYDGFNLYFLDEIEIANETTPISILGDSVFTGLSHADKFGLCEYQISNEGSFHKKDTHLKGVEVLELENSNPYLLGRTREGFLLSSPYQKGSPFEFTKFPISGNFYPTLEEFTHNESEIFIPSGNYGIEKLNFLYQEKNHERRKIAHRRSADSEEWNLIEENSLLWFSQETVPVILTEQNSAGWKYRMNSSVDQNASFVSEHWKNNFWLGNFYSRTYPWIYHQKLKWLYISENKDGIWLWSKKIGWTWTTPEIFPYLFNHNLDAWTFLNLKEEKDHVFQFNFQEKAWEKILF